MGALESPRPAVCPAADERNRLGVPRPGRPIGLEGIPPPALIGGPIGLEGIPPPALIGGLIWWMPAPVQPEHPPRR